ncbi:LpqB family beta-propeller domain-containing protein [Micromonospora sp. MS34]|uniref:LpqB family beta-propeller domain-containing protein n=1 Tax=Micromonospora sp. MS34 TaxID=3385971 RepID=UPI0039A1AF7D
MRRRLLAVLLAGALLPAGLTGCGIPEQTGVQVDGRLGPAAESGSLNGGGSQPPIRTASSEPKQFIENYLAAAAGDRDQAYDRVREFLAPEAKDRLRPRQSSEIELTVVRLRDTPEDTLLSADGLREVRVKVQQVGVLRADGTLAPPVASDSEYVFKLRQAEPADQGLWITELPSALLLTDTALRTYYRAHTIYFWNTDQSRLVPDLRYLPFRLPTERRVTEVVTWLTGGPPDWLASGVRRLPDGTSRINNATGSDGHWEVNLNMPRPNDGQLAKLATQLAWSLSDLTGQLDLKIQAQKRRTIDLKEERIAHPAYPPGGSPQRFAVYDNAIHALAVGDEPAGSVPVVGGENKNVVSAALSRADDQVLAGLVVARADRRQRLKVGFGQAPVTVFNSSKDWYASLGRPTWLRSLDKNHPAGLVVADRKLYLFDGDATMSRVPLTVSGPVAAVAGSLDGHRIALVIGGGLYVASVSVDGESVNVNQPRRLTTRLTDITAVDWCAEGQLAFAGNDKTGRRAIYQTSVDGALDTPLKEDIGAEVTHLSSYPGVAGAVSALSFMYEAKVAYHNNPFDTIKRAEVVPTPAAGAKVSNPTVPFFYY